LEFVTFASERAARILEQAYIKDTGSWARRIDGEGQLDIDKEWWILAELDQTAATLALIDPAYAYYLPQTYDYWLTKMVDHKHKGVWHLVKGSNNTPQIDFPKQHSWKNAFHTFEHALVSYLTAQQLHDELVTLHFAFKENPPSERIHPYLFLGKLKGIIEVAEKSDCNLPASRHVVTFSDIR
jgi:hypothetical protein